MIPLVAVYTFALDLLTSFGLKGDAHLYGDSLMQASDGSPRARGPDHHGHCSQSRSAASRLAKYEAVGCNTRLSAVGCYHDETFVARCKAAGAAPKHLVAEGSRCGQSTGILTVSVVPLPVGLDTVNLPETDSTRSLSPISPEPPPRTAPPTPLSLTDTCRCPSSTDALT